MRHGPAEDEASDGLDASRALTPPGRERVRVVAKALASFDEVPKTIVSSPLVRALQTAEIVATTLGVEPVVAHNALAPRGLAEQLVREHARKMTRRLMIVGHEPDLSMLCAELVGEAMAHAMMKAMVVGISVPTLAMGEGGACSLRFVLDPKSLHMLVDHRAATRPG